MKINLCKLLGVEEGEEFKYDFRNTIINICMPCSVSWDYIINIITLLNNKRYY